MSRLSLAVLLLLLAVYTPNLHALDITLDGSRTVLTGVDCEVATYSFGINETWNGQLLDLHVNVHDEDNENTAGDCVGVLDNIFTVNLRDKDPDPDTTAYVDAIFTIVQRGTTTPVFVDRITATGFDLDNTNGTGTDDIYFTGVEAPYLSDLSQVTFNQGNFVGGHDFHYKGQATGNCTDALATPVPECRAAASWVGGENNQIASIRARFQNDDAYSSSTNNAALRRLQLSFEIRHAEEVISDTTDRGDAPASYGDALHPITSLNTLLSNGLAPDNDRSPNFSNGNADDDDVSTIGTTGIAKYDDEDSVTYNGLPLSDQTLDAGATETMEVLTFGSGYLSAWIDLNIDGDFTDPGEQILTDVEITGTSVQTTPVSVTIPQTAAGGYTYARFRFNNEEFLNSSEPGVDGEVEDYRVFIATMDPTFNMVKTASPAVLTAAGDITYTFTFNNTGNAVLSDLTVTDPGIDSGSLSGCPIATLAAGQSAFCTATRAVSQVQIDSGVALGSTATPTGTNPLGGAAIETTDTDNTVLTTIAPVYAIAVNQTQPVNADEDGSGDISAGDTLSYTVTATNTGTATVTNMQVSDPVIATSSANCASVAPGGICTLTGSLTVTPADTGSTISNTATADSDQTGQVTDTLSVVVPSPSLIVSKALPTNTDEDGSTDVSLNDTLSYTVTATNNGGANLTDVVVEDLVLSPSSFTCPTLAPTATCVLTGIYVVASADLASGTIDNTATADSVQTDQVSDSNSVSVPAPAISLELSAPVNADNDGSTDVSVGDVLSYTVTATNSGTSILTGVVVNDPMLSPDSATCATLAAGETCVLTGTYTVTTADSSAGSIINTASVNSVQAAEVTDTETVALPAPALSIAIDAPVNADDDNSTDVSEGDVLSYTVTATNTGLATLTDVVVADPMLSPSAQTCASVAAGESCVLQGTYTVAAADVAAGAISNTASADSAQTPVLTDTEVLAVPVPGLTVTNATPVNADNDGSGDISAGDVLTYTVIATNTGAAVLNNVVLADPMLSPASSTCATLAVSDTCVLSGSYTVTADDVTAAAITNTATAGSDETGQVSDAGVVALPVPGLSVTSVAPVNADEDGSGDITVGDTLTYTLTATNTGTSTLTNIVVSDPIVTPDSTSCASVAAGGTCVLTANYTLTQADVTAGTVDNTASANSDQTAVVTDIQSTAVPAPAVSLLAAAPLNADEDGSGDISAGDTLTYTITATNVGASNLTDVLVSDPLLSPTSNTCALLPIGADCVLSATYNVSDSDVAAGLINNTASVVSDQTSAVDTARVVNLPSPSHTLNMPPPVNADEDGSGDVSVGDTLTYTITATNTGSATLTNLVVTGPGIAPDSNTCVLVATGSTCVLTGSYQVTATDVNNGSIDNTATAVADQSLSVDDAQSVVVPNPVHAMDLSAPLNADEDGSTDVSAGDTLTYVITATNTGAATLTNLVITDPMLTPASSSCASVAPGASCELTGTYTVTAADVAAGTIVNVADSESDQTASLQDTETVPVPAPAKVIAMPVPVNADEDGSGDISAGDTLTYIATVTNNGSATLTNVTVSDPMTTPGSNTCAMVVPAATCTLTGTYSVSAADVAAGTINITATAVSDQTAATDVVNSLALLVPDLAISQPAPANTDEDGSGDVSVGDTLTYTITATNNGAATLTNVTVSDPMISPDSTQCAIVAPAATCVLTGTYTVTAGDLAVGQIDSTASANSDQTGAVTDSESVPVLSPELTLVKSAPNNADQDGSGDISVGDVLTYTVVATNTGAATLTGVTVEDPMISPAATACAIVAPGSTCELTGTYTVAAGDVTAGSIDSTATAASDQTAAVTDSDSVPVGVPSYTLSQASPALSDVDGSGDISAGDTLTYTITATNNGAAVLTDLTINDPMITPASVTCDMVAIGDTCELTGTYVVTTADVAAGSLDNTANSDSVQSGPLSASQSVALNAPSLVLEKTVPVNADEDGNGAIGVGDTLTYTVAATNNGAANLTNVTVDVPMISPASVTCAVIAPGETCELSGTYPVVAQDVSAGVIDNTAVAASDQTGQLDDTVSVVVPMPAMTLDTAPPVNDDRDGSGDISAGDVLTYTVTANNTGAVNLTNVQVNDAMLSPSSASCPVLQPGDACVLSGSYTVSAADVNNAAVDNAADAYSDQVAAIQDTHSIVLLQPSLALDSSTPVNTDLDGSGDISAGDVLSYTVTATNNGGSTLTNVVINDPLINPDQVLCASVAAGATCTLTGDYTVTAADVVSGVINNSANADSDQTGVITDSESVIVPTPLHTLVNTPPAIADNDSSGDISVGDVLTYTITANNTGTAILTNLSVSDPMIAPSANICAVVPVGGDCVLVGTYTVVADDVTAGSITNAASSVSDQSAPVDDTRTIALNAPSLDINNPAPLNADEDGSGDVSAGDTLTYTITATNNGSSNLTDVVVNDPLIIPDSTTCATLATGAACILSGTYTVTPADVSAGVIVSTATANSVQTSAVTDDESVVVPAPQLALDQTAPVNSDPDGSGDISAGDVLTYTYTATNTGTATLTDVVVEDPMITPSGASCSLVSPGATCVLSGQYTVTAADVAAGVIDNTVTAASSQTSPVLDSESVVLLQPDLVIALSALVNADEDGSGDISAGDTLTYTATATNTGSATLTELVVSDALSTPGSINCATVPAGATCVLNGVYTVTAANVSAGVLNNAATAVSEQAGPVDDSNSLNLPQPLLALSGSAPLNSDEDGSGDISAGDTLTYTLTAINSGTATLTGVVVNDPLIAPSAQTCAVVLAGDTCVLSGTTVVSAADVAAGVINNTASAGSDQSNSVIDSGSVVVPDPLHTLVKSLPANTDNDNSGDISAGDLLTYTITATNTGTATLTDLVISDPLVSPSSISCAVVSVGDTCVLSGTYQVTAADIMAGAITGTATSVSVQSPMVDDTQTLSLNAPGLTLNLSTPVNADEDGSTDVSVGDTLTYTVTATNTGSSNLTNVVVNDPLLTPDSTTCAVVATGGTCILTGTYSVTAADVTAASIANTATAVSDQTPEATDQVDLPVGNPLLAVNKAPAAHSDLDGSADVSAGDVLGYTITATNNGTAMLTNVVVGDPLITPSSESCAMLAPGAVCVLTGAYTVTAADVVAGVIDSTATAGSDQTTPVTDSESVVLAAPALALSRSGPVNADEDGSGDVSIGDTLSYTVTASNTGSATLTDVVVNDTLIVPASVTCATVAAGATCVLSGNHTVTAANISSGMISSTASADSVQTAPVSDNHELTLLQPQLTLSKAAPVNADEDNSGDVSAGDTLSYTVTATNSGSSTLTDVVVNDPLISPATMACATVATGDLCVLTGTYTVTAEDVAAGVINSTAVADSDQTDDISDSDTLIVPQPMYTLVTALPVNTDIDNSTDISAGDILTYTITATNTGTANLTNLVVSDAMLSPDETLCALLLPGQTCVLTGTYTVTAADIAAGAISNAAASRSGQSTVLSDTRTLNLNTPSLVVDLSAPVNSDEDGSTDISAGDTLTYTVVATNNGMATLTAVVLSDDMITPATTSCDSLLAGEECVLSGSYTVTAADVLAGEIVNQAQADSNQTPAVSDVEISAVPQPQLAIVKAAPVNADQDGSADISVGDVLTYTVTATNTGTAFLTNLQVSDASITPAVITCDVVAPGAVCVLSGTYTVGVADLAAGVIAETASAISDQTGSVEDTHSLVVPLPAMELTQSIANTDADGSGDISVGDVITYTLTATNTGSSTLTGVSLDAAMISPSTLTCNTVAAGDSCVLEGSYTVTAADIAAGSIVNPAAAVSAQTPQAPAEHTVVLPQPSLIVSREAPSIIDADGSGDVSAGDTLTFVITATNNGSANLTDVTVTDPLLTPGSANCALLLPAESCVLSGSMVVTGADVTAGEIVNTGSAESAQTPPVEDTRVQNLAGPAHSVAKVLSGNADEDGSGDISAGDTLTYTVTVSNSGNATLTNVLIYDPLLTPNNRQCPSVSAGEQCRLVGSYNVTEANVQSGLISSAASGESDQTDPTSSPHEVVVPLPAYTLVNSIPVNTDEDGSNDVSVDDTLTYTVTVRNTGTATLTGVVIDDPMISPSSLVCPVLAAAEECVLVGSYRVDALDLMAGLITNPATADSDQLAALEDIVVINLNQPALSIEVQVADNNDEDGSGDISAGDTLIYRVTAINNGTSALTNVQVNDDLLNPASQTCALLAPGESCVLSGIYRVSGADVDDGRIVNTAGAGSDQTPPVAQTLTTVMNQPALTLVKSLNGNGDEDGTGDITLGDTLQYSIVATNTGTAVLTNVLISDTGLSPNAANCATLAPQSTCELQGYYVVTADDVSAGEVVGVATVIADQLPQADSTHTAEIKQPALTLVKSASFTADNDGSGNVTVNDVLTYTLVATNTGATALSNVVISDALLGNHTCVLLAPGETCTLTGDYTVAANDAEAGGIENTASVDSDQTVPVEAAHAQEVTTILPPVTTDNRLSDLPLGRPVTIAVLVDDTDAEDNIDPATVRILASATAEPVITLEVPGEGVWSVDVMSGDITFTPYAGYIGSPAPIQYVVSDTTGLVSNPSTVTLEFEAPASLTGTVWLDINKDGQLDPLEPVMSGWTLNLYNDDGALVTTTVTAEDGTYAIPGLAPSEYTVHFLNEAGVFMAEATTGGVLQAGQSIDLPLPIDPSGIVYDSVTREPVADVTLQLVNSAGVVIDPVCLNANQQNQTTRADGYYAFDVFPDAHPSCPLEDVYSIRIASLPATYENKVSEFIPPRQATFDGAATEEDCTVDAIPGSGNCEVQEQAGGTAKRPGNTLLPVLQAGGR